MVSALSAVTIWARRLGRRLRSLLIRRLFDAGPLARRLLVSFVDARTRQLIDQVQPDFYLAQIPPGRGRVRARQDPGLHYALVGARLGRSPRPGFDPLFVWRDNPQIGGLRYAFRAFLEAGAVWPMNAVEARGMIAPLSAEPKHRIAVMTHPRGGGSAYWLDLLASRLAVEDTELIQPIPVQGANGLMAIRTGAGYAWYDLVINLEAFLRALKAAGASRLLVNHIIDLPECVIDALPEAAKTIDLPLDVHLHDYYYICPRVNLIDSRRAYCGLPEADVCRRCVAESQMVIEPDLESWRARRSRLTRAADSVVAPSRDLADRLSPRLQFSRNRISVMQPESDDGLPTMAPPLVVGSDAVKVCVLGALNVAKGGDVVLRLARRLRGRSDMSLIVVGEAEAQSQLSALGVRVTGYYRPGDVTDLLDQISPDIFLFPAIWPETWSFTLSIALRRGTPILAFDIGAIAERLKAAGRGVLLPTELANDPEFLADTLFRLARSGVRSAETTTQD